MTQRKTRGLHATRHLPPGSAPGTLVARPGSRPTRLELRHYAPGRPCTVASVDQPARQLEEARRAGGVVWVHVQGLDDVAAITALGEAAGIHPLALEDVLAERPRPKSELYGAHLFLTLPAVGGSAAGPGIAPASIFLAPGLLVSFSEEDAPWLDPVRARLDAPGSPLLERGADWLAYTLVDSILDLYFPLLERYGTRLEQIEEEVTRTTSRDLLHEIMSLRHDLVAIGRVAWPLREALHTTVRDTEALIDEHTRIYLRDCQDHVVQVLDLVDAYRDLAASLLDVHLTALGHRTNEVMKVLTIIATIFMPLSFLASLYGMNFDRASPFNQPELGWRHGYPLLLGLMLVVTLGLVVFFRRRGWIGGAPGRLPDR